MQALFKENPLKHLHTLSSLTTGALLLIVSIGHAASGREGAAFLNIPTGARPTAMGGAYSALATDAYAVTVNPGGLSLNTHPNLATQHLWYLESLQYEYASFVFPYKRHAFGAAVQYLGADDFEGTDALGNPTGGYRSSFGAYSLSYGFALKPSWGIGVTGKWIQSKLESESAGTASFDAGTYYRLSPKWSFGLSVANMGQKTEFISEADELPLALQLGAAWRPGAKWTLSAQETMRRHGERSTQLGVEWCPIKYLALRTGYRTDVEEQEDDFLSGWSGGMGILFANQEIGYAWVPYGDLGNASYISWSIRFGEVKS